MRYRILQTSVVATLIAVIVPAVATADKFIEAQTVWQFDAASYTIDQGELLTFRNADALSPGPHDVTATDKGADGKPLFASKTIPNGEEAPVEGARQVKTGSYGFFCSVHSFMTATVVVSDKGTPLPPAGSAPPPPPAPPAAAPDTRRPDVDASLKATTLRRALKARSFTAVITADEVTTLRVRLTAYIGGRHITVGTATGRIKAPNGHASIKVRIGSSARRSLSRVRRASLALGVEGRDAAGNVGHGAARRTVKR